MNEPYRNLRLMAIMAALRRERDFQDKKYGPVLEKNEFREWGESETRQGPGGHELGAWLIVIEKELDEAKDACIHGGHSTGKGRNSIRSEILQIAAVCIAALEQHGLEEES